MCYHMLPDSENPLICLLYPIYSRIHGEHFQKLVSAHLFDNLNN